jgi:uncharacterized protein
MSVPTGSVVVFTQALHLVGLDRASGVYWAGRATLVRREEDVPIYDRVFASYWQDRPVPLSIQSDTPTPLTLAVDDESDDDSEPDPDPGDDENEGGDVLALRYSAVEILQERDVSSLTPEEWAEAQRLISALRVSSELRPSRRTRPSRRRSRGHPDLRGTVRRNLPNGGVPIERAWKRAVLRPRRLVFLLDVSGSMESYARGLARFAHAAVASRRAGRVEVFTMGTRLTRITRELARRDPDAALLSASRSVSDWSGGTRIGTSLQQFNAEWGIRGMARGAVVVICSDGWDRGDPDLVASEMARLALVARRVVWVNPLKASPGYAPLARGMAAALPFVDQFVEGHAVASLEHLAEIIAGPRVKEARL